MQGVGVAFFLGILGFLCSFWVLIKNRKFKEQYLKNMSWFFYFLLLFWALLGFFSLKEGARFIMLLIPPMVVSSGIMVGLTIDYLALLKKSDKLHIFKNKETLIKFISILILFAVSVSSILLVCESFINLKPGTNDDLQDASLWINNNTPVDTVIISDWSYGHFLAAVADRPVSFDGRTAYIETLPSRQFDDAYPFGSQSPSTSREYWIDRAFATDNESLSLGIFNMIATSGDLGYITLDKYTENTTRSVEILNDILGVNRETAEMILTDNYGLNQTAAENVLQYTHPTNPRHFVVLTNGLSGVYWIFHFGTWDFNKMQGGNYTYSYGVIHINDNILSSHDGVNMNLDTGNVTWKGETPYCLITVTNGTIEKHYIDNNSNICIVLLMDNMQSVVIDRQFENSTFTKLWLERANSTSFKLVYSHGDAAVWEAS
jgi:dolichyl-diphosphooligosaccharide--protein glycosyltransferase